MVDELRERSLAVATERMIGWFRIIGGVVGIGLTVTDQVVHPTLERDLEVASLGLLAALGVATLVWLRREPSGEALQRWMVATYVVDALVLLAQAPLHAFVALEAPSPALLVPLLGAVRFGYRGTVPGVVGVAVAYGVRGIIAVRVYDHEFGIDPAAVSMLLAAIIGLITAHLFTTARAGREQADAATALAGEATLRAEALHRVLEDGVGSGVGPVADRLVHTVRQVLDADGVLLVVHGDEEDDEVRVVAGSLAPPDVAATPDDDGRALVLPHSYEQPVTYGEVTIGRVVVVGPRRMAAELPAIARQVGLAVHAARLLDREAGLAARYRGLDALRSDFVTLTSHELRTPVAAIAGAAETLREHGDGFDDEARKEFMELIERQAARLARLVDDLLTVGRNDAGQLRYDPRYVPMTALVDGVSRALERSFAVDGEVDRLVWVDPGRATQVLLNLVENAFEHGVEPVEVRIEVDGDVLAVAVVDDGPGIPPDDHEKVFERFVQLGPLVNHSRGTGLGLGISRDLVRAMGGEVRVDAAAPSTTFVLELPLHPSGERIPVDRRTRPRR